MKIIHFIVNPISGKGKPTITAQYLSNHFDKKDYSVTVRYSEYKGHAIPLTVQSIKEKADIIVACGGDGTINEVASCLVNTNITLGIIPIGSGNGLARNLKISTNIEKAIKNLKENGTIAIDVGKINDEYFFSNTGIGFVANTISKFESSTNRRLHTYILATIQAVWSYRNNTNYIIDTNGKKQTISPFLILISNTNIMGYNFSMTRKAKLNDGLLDLIIIDKLSRVKMIYFGFLFLFGLEHTIREYSYQLIKRASITFETENPETLYQIDGELRKTDTSNLEIDVFKRSLIVISPMGN